MEIPNYNSQFLEFVDVKNKIIKSNEDVANHIDFIKQIDLTKYNIEGVEQKNTIEVEVKKWKKFYLNNYQKTSRREFEPFITKGEIADFIIKRLGIFDEYGGVIGLDSPIKLDEIAKKLLYKQIAQIRRAKNNYEAMKQAITLFNFIKNKITNPVSLKLLQDSFTGFLLEVKSKLDVESVVDALRNSLPNNLKKILQKETQDNVIDFIFNSLTDYDLRALPDFPEFSGFGNRLRARWREFLRTAVFKVNRPIKPTDVFDIVLDVIYIAKKDFLNTKNLFKVNFNTLLSQAFNKRLSALDLNSKLRELLRNYGRSAFRNGIEQLGLDPRDFHVIENLVISKMNNYVRFYVTSLTSKLFSGAIDLGKALLKSDLWSNKFIDKLFEFGRLAGDKNGLYEWVYGDTKHCGSCLHANGQRHRLKHWHQAGILPQSNGHKELICGGFYCKCKLVRVTGYSRGRLSSIPTK